MTVLWINFFTVFMTSLFARYFSTSLTSEVTYIKPNKFLIFISIASLVIVSGLRNNIGDTGYYILGYVSKSQLTLSDIEFEGEFGFVILQILLHQISSDPQIFIFTIALITNLLIVLVLYKYSRMIELSLFVYIAFGMFTVSMNGVRQFLAAAIIFAATKYILNGNWRKFIVIVLLASTIHKSALILIPIYFIVRREAWTKVTFLLLLSSVIITMGYNKFSEVLFSIMEETQYGNYSDSSYEGANILRVAVTIVPIIIAFLGREKLRELWPQSDYIVNLSIIGLIFMVVATQNWIFARFHIYFGLYNLILISWIIVLFSKNNRKFIYFSMLILFLIYFYYEQVITLNLVYKSNFLNW